MLKKILKEATRIEQWQQEIYTALHNINAEWITSGRLSLSRLPDGEADRVLVAQGLGKDPVWADPNFNLIRIGGVDITGRDWSLDFAKLQNLDVSLSALAALKRWGRNVAPSWVLGAELTAPAAGTNLVSKAVSSGKSGYVYGLVISAGEANDFKLNWNSEASAKSLRFVLVSKGSIALISPVALNEGLPADGGSSITITNVNAGASGIVYQAMLLYAEV
jgi:hypothetical protein